MQLNKFHLYFFVSGGFIGSVDARRARGIANRHGNCLFTLRHICGLAWLAADLSDSVIYKPLRLKLTEAFVRTWSAT